MLKKRGKKFFFFTREQRMENDQCNFTSLTNFLPSENVESQTKSIQMTELACLM